MCCANKDHLNNFKLCKILKYNIHFSDVGLVNLADSDYTLFNMTPKYTPVFTVFSNRKIRTKNYKKIVSQYKLAI